MTDISQEQQRALDAREDKSTLKSLGVLILGFAAFALVLALAVAFLAP